MIIVKIKAGLGNQMFQYACGRALSLRNNDLLKLDITDWLHNKETKRDYLLNNFNINAEIATPEELKIIKFRYGPIITKIINKLRNNISIINTTLYKRIPRKSGDIYLDGYWQSENFFSDFSEEIRNDFTLKNALSVDATNILTKIQRDNSSVSLHIRRGDNAHEIASMKAFGCPGIEYYESCIKVLIDNLKNSGIYTGSINLYVFSDEIDWVKQNLHTDFPTIFVTSTNIDLCEEIMLMCACKHNIISNSTFGWWGAWLNKNPDKIVVAPRQWALKRLKNFKDIIPKNWIRI